MLEIAVTEAVDNPVPESFRWAVVALCAPLLIVWL